MTDEFELILATDTRLNGISRCVSSEELGGEYIENVVNSMLRIAIGERDEDHPNMPTLVGLAAPQIGAFVRIILFDKNGSQSEPNFNPELEVIANPVITRTSDTEELGREGCYSTADITAVVYRATELELSGQNKDGKAVNYHLSGFQARIVQHEVDHLNGVRCPDRIRNLQRLHRVEPDEFQSYRDNWRTWTKLCPIEDWLSMKNGRNTD